MTAVEAYDLVTQGGVTDFARLIATCESLGHYCVIGDLAVNCYVEPIYTLDVDLVVREHPHSVNALAPESKLRIQFTTDERYQAFLDRAVEAEVLGVRAKIACLADITQGKLWA